MKNNSFTIIAALLMLGIGLGIGYGLWGAHEPDADEHETINEMMGHDSMGTEMETMLSGLEGKSGDDFDKAFLSEMVVHHQGALSMAQAALQHAEHQEIKQMAENIISAQTAEIKQMQEWQQNWYH